MTEVLKRYTISIAEYPREYTIDAIDERHAIELAKERFSEDTDGKSVWESRVESVE